MKIGLQFIAPEVVPPPKYTLTQVKNRQGWYQWVITTFRNKEMRSSWRLYSDGHRNIISINPLDYKIIFHTEGEFGDGGHFESVTNERITIEY